METRTGSTDAELDKLSKHERRVVQNREAQRAFRERKEKLIQVGSVNMTKN